MKWKNFGETTTEEAHTVFFSGKEDKNEHGVEFLFHKDIVNTVIGCRSVSSRLITTRLGAVPFNIRIVQAHAPTSDYDDNIPYRIGRYPGQQGPRLPPYTRTKESSVLLVHHRRFVEETTSPSALGKQGH